MRLFDAVLVLGKELRHDPTRARRELQARCAAAAVALRQGAQVVATLEAPLRGQDISGSTLVVENLRALGVPAERIVQQQHSHSTREEAMLARTLAAAQGWRRLLVLTSAYHVPRARRIFLDHFAEGAVTLHAPEGFWRDASPEERAWIAAGTPSVETLAAEGH